MAKKINFKKVTKKWFKQICASICESVEDFSKTDNSYEEIKKEILRYTRIQARNYLEMTYPEKYENKELTESIVHSLTIQDLLYKSAYAKILRSATKSYNQSHA